ncbi:MAG: hypothetical protein F6K31_09165 [Symploca sp. SIO2G7]|nr:hypothetical protein [Symploca sp. SIO2G7]
MVGYILMMGLLHTYYHNAFKKQGNSSSAHLARKEERKKGRGFEKVSLLFHKLVMIASDTSIS